jgi:hypothetical protein
MLPCEEASEDATSRTEPENKVPYLISPRGDIEQAFLLLEAESIPAEQSAHTRSGCDWAEEMEEPDKQRHYQQQLQEESRKMAKRENGPPLSWKEADHERNPPGERGSCRFVRKERVIV